jgi:predicted HTH transcriptional regulator
VPYDERDENSRFTPSFSDEDVVAFLRDRGDVTSVDVAETFDCTRQNAHYRLSKLRDAGVVASRKIGNTNVWTVDETGSS